MSDEIIDVEVEESVILPPIKVAQAKVVQDEKEDDPNIYICEDELEVTVKQIPPMLLQKVMNSVKMPDRPTYETKTFTGRTEIWPLDEVSAEQEPHGESRWEYYNDIKTERQNDQNERVTMAAFLFGTECEIPENGWDKKQAFLSIEVPTNPDERRAHYLATELSAKDVAGLMTKVMGTLQLPEGVVDEAEGSFQRAIRD